MNYPLGSWTTIGDYRDISDGQRILFRRRETPDEPRYMLEYPFDCFTACAIFEPMTDDMRNWKGVGICYLSVGCSDMFIHLIDALNDRPFGIGGIEGETGRYDSKDFETNLYSAMSTACSQWIDKIKEYDSRYNKKVDKMSFNDMVKKQRANNNSLVKSRVVVKNTVLKNHSYVFDTIVDSSMKEIPAPLDNYTDDFTYRLADCEDEIDVLHTLNDCRKDGIEHTYIGPCEDYLEFVYQDDVEWWKRYYVFITVM